MKVYHLPAGMGKTTALIRDCSRFGGYIVCCNRARAKIIFRKAKELGWDIPLPITFREFLEHAYEGRDIKHFFIDDIDLLLQKISSVPVEAITLRT